MQKDAITRGIKLYASGDFWSKSFVFSKGPVADPAGGGGGGGYNPLFQNLIARRVCLSTPISLLLSTASGLRNSVRYRVKIRQAQILSSW